MISRAHRMGATRPIFVETLAMSGTIEDQMLKFLQVVCLFNILLAKMSIWPLCYDYSNNFTLSFFFLPKLQ